MDRLNAVVDSARGRLADLADRLYGCAHRKTTFPMTLRASAKMNGEQSFCADTYIVCLECGRHFAYDWTTMQITGPRLAWFGSPALVPALGEASRGPR